MNNTKVFVVIIVPSKLSGNYDLVVHAEQL